LAHDLDLGSDHTAYHRVSLINVYLLTNFIEIEETFCERTDERMDVRTYAETEI